METRGVYYYTFERMQTLISSFSRDSWAVGTAVVGSQSGYLMTMLDLITRPQLGPGLDNEMSNFLI